MRDQSWDDENCPVCGYYCLGRGGIGCIEKPGLTGLGDVVTPTKSKKGVDPVVALLIHGICFVGGAAIATALVLLVGG